MNGHQISMSRWLSAINQIMMFALFNNFTSRQTSNWHFWYHSMTTKQTDEIAKLFHSFKFVTETLKSIENQLCKFHPTLSIDSSACICGADDASTHQIRSIPNHVFLFESFLGYCAIFLWLSQPINCIKIAERSHIRKHQRNV